MAPFLRLGCRDFLVILGIGSYFDFFMMRFCFSFILSVVGCFPFCAAAAEGLASSSVNDGQDYAGQEYAGHVYAERKDSVVLRAEAVVSVGGGEHSPFWFANGNFGVGSIEKNNGYLRVSAVKPMNRHTRWDWGAGVDLIGGFRREAPFAIQQLYGEIRYRCLDLMIGQKEIQGVMNNPRLSSGNLLYGNNSMPIPQVRAGIFDYADIWGTKGWLGIKGYLAFGKFTDSRWLRNWVDDGAYPQGALYHSKGLWLRNGNAEKFPLTFEAGIEMATQFAGTCKYWHVTSPYHPAELKTLKMPSGLKAWWKALVPLGGDDSTGAGEINNVQGNFLGNWTFALAWTPKADWSIRAYYEHFFEDHSMLYIDYPWKDGMWGVEAQLPRNRFVSRVVYEFINSKDQSGAAYWDERPDLPIQVSGSDNYYSHYLYGAWQNWGRIIGTPFAVSPIYANHTLTLMSTRFQAHHLGFEGNPTDDISYRVLLSYSRNWGTYSHPLPEVESNFDFLAEVSWKPTNIRALRGWEGNLSIGADGGRLLGGCFGVRIGVARSFGWGF